MFGSVVATPLSSIQGEAPRFAESAERAPPKVSAPHDRAYRLFWLMGALVGLLAGWSIAGNTVVGTRLQQAVEASGILLAGGLGLFLGMYTRRRNVQLERAYSTHLEELSQRLRNLAYRDSLTDLYNHRYFYEQLTHEVDRAQRYGRPVSVILLDLDQFKRVNDVYGHLMGNKLLALIGQIIKDQVRGSDIPARYGGDEFAIILPDTPRAAAEATARKLAKAIAAGRASVAPLNEQLPVSAACGVACCPDDARSVSELLQLADTQVYALKSASARALAAVAR